MAQKKKKKSRDRNNQNNHIKLKEKAGGRAVTIIGHGRACLRMRNVIFVTGVVVTRLFSSLAFPIVSELLTVSYFTTSKKKKGL